MKTTMESKELKESQIGPWFRSFEKAFGFKNDIKWLSVAEVTLYHSLVFYMAACYAFPVKWQTVLFAAFLYIMSGFGVTGGAHRLWSHRSFKATLPLKIWILMWFSAAGQGSLLNWVRDHRVHHKFSDTAADPHDIRRGLFFSHVGWLMMRRDEEVIRRGREIDLSDIKDDPVLRFHEKYFNWFKLLFCYVVPVSVGVWWLGEAWRTAVAWQLMRHLALRHVMFSLNSLAHTFGYQPYNKNIRPTQNMLVSLATFGEGWHNYHHSFPFDYKGAEAADALSITTNLIRLSRALGLAYDLKEATPEMISSVARRLGDGSHCGTLKKYS